MKRSHGDCPAGRSRAIEPNRCGAVSMQERLRGVTGWRGFCAAFAVSMLAGGAAFAADPVQGGWLTQPDDNGHYGRVEIAPCGERLCGTLTAAYGADGKAVPSDRIGKRIVWDMQPAGSGRYENGQIFAPDRGKTYSSKMALAGDKLTVSGCVLILCRSQVWSRAK